MAAQFFAQRGWEVLDADQVAHELYRPYKRVWREVVDRFGEGILNKNDVVDRQKLKQIVFNPSSKGKKALADLNQIIHPELKRYLKDEVYYLQKRKKNVVVVGTLWEEIGLFKLCEKVMLIQAGDALTYERIHKRDGMDFDMFETINAQQKDPPKPDFVVQNEGDVQGVYKQLNVILNSL